MERAIFFAVLLASTSLYALVRGGTPERLTALGYLAAYAASAFFVLHNPTAWQSVSWVLLLIDIALAVVLVFIALYANRYWTMWAASAQIASIGAHFAKFVAPEIVLYAYGLTAIFWSYLSLPILFFGTMRHEQRQKLYGSDISWTIFSDGK